MSVGYLAFNLEAPPFDDLNVRKALAMTVDRERINEVLFYDTQRVADGILPPEVPGYDESVSSYGYDPVEARRLLDASNYAGNMPRIILSFSGAGGDAPTTLQAIQENWRTELGIEVELQATEYSAFLRELRRGTFQLFSAGWAADYPDPEDFIDKLFADDSPQNEQSYSNDEVQALIEAARAETDTERRFQLLRDAEQLILDDAAVIPTFWPIDHLLVKPCVANWPGVSMTVPKYRYIEIDPNTD
jgi:oligopeptide transport system substrate-binding protein